MPMKVFLDAPVLAVMRVREAIQADELSYGDRYKRWLDCLFALLGLLFCFPILLLIGLLVVITSRGPVLFVQERVGRYGQPFNIYKFRTMVEGAHKYGSVTNDADHRLTAAGKFLRETKIDELPQILNILKGDMSIIGPRPLSIAETEEIQAIGFDANRPGFFHVVRPGLIGLEQINRKTRRLDYEARFQFNREYEERLGFGLDCCIFATALIQCRFVCSLAIMSAILELFAIVFVH